MELLNSQRYLLLGNTGLLKAMRKPTGRTKQYLEKQGAIFKVVERYNQYSKRFHDAFGADGIYIMGTKCVATQCTSDSNRSSRVAKSLDNPEVRAWLRVPYHGFEVWTWGKKGARGKRKLWTAHVTHFGLNDREEVIVVG